MGALTTAANVARIARDTAHAENDAAAAAERRHAALTEYKENVRAAHAATVLAFGDHADDITWSRVHDNDTMPYGSHTDFPARFRLAWVPGAGLRACAVPIDTRNASTAGRPVPIGEPGISNLAELGDALAAWEADQARVGQ